MNLSTVKTVGVAAVVYSIWASTWPVGKIALSYWTPTGLTCIRHVLAGFLLISLGRFLGDSFRLPSRQEVSLGFFQYALYYIFSYESLSRGSTAVTAVVVALYPATVLIFSHGGAASRTWRLLPAFLGAIGCALVLLKSPNAFSETITISSILFAICAALSQSVATLIKRETLSRVKIISFTGRSMFTGGLLASVFVFSNGTPLLISGPNLTALITLTWLSLMGSAVTFVAVEYLLRQWQPAFFSISYLAVPCLAVILSNIFLNEKMSFNIVVGIFVCLTAIALATFTLKRGP